MKKVFYRKKPSGLLVWPRYDLSSTKSRVQILVKHRKETSTAYTVDSLVCVKFPIRTGATWELWLKPSHIEKTPVPSSGTFKSWDDDITIANFIIFR